MAFNFELKERVCQACGAVFMGGWAAKWCPECRVLKRRENNRRYAESEKGRASQRRKNRAYQEKHPEKKQEAQRKWYRNNRGKQMEKQRLYYQQNRDSILARMKVYHAQHVEEHREHNRRYREQHLEAIQAREKAYREKNHDLILQKQRLNRRARKGDGGAAFELLKLQGKVEECPRTHSLAVNLPCGRESYCWGGKPCERATSKGCKRPVEASCGWNF